MCWQPKPSKEVFDSSSAEKVAVGLCFKVADETERLRSLLEQMLNVAENADETGYVTDVGFVDIDKLHGEVRAALT